MEENIKSKYLEKAKKQKLPDFDILNNEFEITTAEHTEFILREVRRKITEKLDFYARLLEELLSAEPTINSLHECKFLLDDKKKVAYDVHRTLMLLIRGSAETSITNSDEENAAYIRNAMEQWQNIKPTLKEIVILMKDSWKEELSEKEELGYFG
jgi:hypothetical protein